MKKLLLTIHLFCFISNLAKAQVQVVTHTKAIELYTQNMAVKQAKKTLYKEAVEEIKEIKQDILLAKGVIEEAQRMTYNGLTEVHNGIKEAKKFYYALESIKRIEQNLSEAHSLALGIKIFSHWETASAGSSTGGAGFTTQRAVYKNPILPLHIKYNKLVMEQITQLITFVTGFIQRQGGDNGNSNISNGSFADNSVYILSNVMREKFLSDVYRKVYAIEITTRSYLHGVKTVKWQSDANNIIPYKMFIYDDINIMNRIKSKINF